MRVSGGGRQGGQAVGTSHAGQGCSTYTRVILGHLDRETDREIGRYMKKIYIQKNGVREKWKEERR